METRNGGLIPPEKPKKVDQLDVYQRELHYQKMSRLETGQIDFIYVMRHVLYDLAGYVDSLHAELYALKTGQGTSESSQELEWSKT
jgi:hypothetical protein